MGISMVMQERWRLALPQAEQFIAVEARELSGRLKANFDIDVPSDYLVTSRVKSINAIAEKIRARGISSPDPLALVNDVIGFRVLVLHCGYIDRVLAEIDLWATKAMLKLRNKENRFENPGVGGYRALHLDFRVSEQAGWSELINIGVEVQVTTWLQIFSRRNRS